MNSGHLSPRQRDCLRLVYERQATSKEIAKLLGISKTTVDGYIAEAVQLLGARDRREAAAIAFGGAPRAESGGDGARVFEPSPAEADATTSTVAPAAVRPWRSQSRPRNSLSLAQTIGWIAAIAFGSIVALALTMAVGSGLPSVAWPLIHAIGRLTQ